MLQVGFGFGVLLPCATSATTATVAPSAPISIPLIYRSSAGVSYVRLEPDRRRSSGNLRDGYFSHLETRQRRLPVDGHLLDPVDHVSSLNHLTERRVLPVQ